MVSSVVELWPCEMWRLRIHVVYVLGHVSPTSPEQNRKCAQQYRYSVRHFGFQEIQKARRTARWYRNRDNVCSEDLSKWWRFKRRAAVSCRHALSVTGMSWKWNYTFVQRSESWKYDGNKLDDVWHAVGVTHQPMRERALGGACHVRPCARTLWQWWQFRRVSFIQDFQKCKACQIPSCNLAGCIMTRSTLFGVATWKVYFKAVFPPRTSSFQRSIFAVMYHTSQRQWSLSVDNHYVHIHHVCTRSGWCLMKDFTATRWCGWHVVDIYTLKITVSAPFWNLLGVFSTPNIAQS